MPEPPNGDGALNSQSALGRLGALLVTALPLFRSIGSSLISAYRALRRNATARAGAILIVALAIVAIMFPDLVMDRIDSFDANYLRVSDRDGLILLDTPQVFTRRRLVNDRSIESAWLTQQLDQTNKLLSDSRFARPELIRLAQQRLTALLNSKNSAPNVSAPSDLMDQLTKLDLKATPIDEFEDASAYREAIRDNILSAALDDRHDIEGNALYRLNFNAAILPSREAHHLAAAVVTLSERDASAKNDGTDRYVELMYDWADLLTKQLKRVIDDRSLVIEQDGLSNLPQQEEVDFGAWLKLKMREVLGGSAGMTNGNMVTEAYAEEVFRQFAMRYIHVAAKSALDKSDLQREKIIEASLGHYLNGLALDPARRAAAIAKAQSDCEAKGSYDLNSMGLALPPPPKSGTPSPNSGPQLSSSGAPPQNWIQQCPPKGSPFVNLPSNIKLALIFISAINFVRDNGGAATSCTDTQPAVVDFVLQVVSPDDFQTQTGLPCANAAVELRKMYRLADLVGLRRRLIAAFNAESLMRRRAQTTFPQDRLANGLVLGDIFEKETSEFCYVGICDPVIKPRPCFLRDVCGQSKSGKPDGIGLQDLRDALRQRSNAFTYAIVPYEAVNRIETERLSSMDLAGATPDGQSLSAQLGLSAGKTEAGLERNAAILGIGDWGHLENQGTDSTKFGWVMFPKRTGARASDRQAAQHFAVSALVSIPGWWKAAHLQLRTCWISEDDIGIEANADTLCQTNSDTKTYEMNLRLPAEAEALSENLRFYVVTYPFLVSSKPPEVEVGRPARIVIPGGRLWLSPIVRLGSQQATFVEVLPDMQGLSAYFACVLPLPGTTGGRQSPDSSISEANRPPPSIVVYTSEGVTQEMEVVTLPFTPRMGNNSERPCWPGQQGEQPFETPPGLPKEAVKR